MKVTLWGTRGSLASPGPDTVRFGGNTACVTVVGSAGTMLVMDAGTGIRGLGLSLPESIDRAYILLTQLHMDHIQGLPFFGPLRRRGVKVDIWGPASTTLSLRSRLMRYLSPPLFPVSLREILSDLTFNELPHGVLEINEFKVTAQLVIHPNPTLGYRIEEAGTVVTYIPDHEPALSGPTFPRSAEWTSGYDLAAGADLLIHDSQYNDEMYRTRMGYGHSSLGQAMQFARLASVKRFVPFHHDPVHSDDLIDRLIETAIAEHQPSFEVIPGKEGATVIVNSK
jgi:phosphoribosyl 1,2-cyclic phosphodiesterase